MFGAVFSDAVCEEASPLVGGGSLPCLAVGAEEEFCEGALLSGDWRRGGKSGDMMSILCMRGALR
jgi:hypothetical protein